MTALDGPALYARHAELLSGLRPRSLRVVALDSIEVALGVVATAGSRPGLGEELLAGLWRTAGRRWDPWFGQRLTAVADLVRNHVPDDEEWIERDDWPELLTLAAGVVVTLADDGGSWADRVDEAAGILVDVHQHVDAMVAGDAPRPGPTAPYRPADMPPTPLEEYCLLRQTELFAQLAAGAGPADLRGLARQGREHLTGVVSGLRNVDS
jgi:hypothetical protein